MGVRVSQLRPAQNSSATNANEADLKAASKQQGNINNEISSSNGATSSLSQVEDAAVSKDESRLATQQQNGASTDVTAANGDAQLHGLPQLDGASFPNERYSTLQRQATQLQSFAQRLKRTASIRTKSFKGLLPSLYKRKASTDDSSKQDKMAEADQTAVKTDEPVTVADEQQQPSDATVAQGATESVLAATETCCVRPTEAAPVSHETAHAQSVEVAEEVKPDEVPQHQKAEETNVESRDSAPVAEKEEENSKTEDAPESHQEKVQQAPEVQLADLSAAIQDNINASPQAQVEEPKSQDEQATQEEPAKTQDAAVDLTAQEQVEQPEPLQPQGADDSQPAQPEQLAPTDEKKPQEQVQPQEQQVEVPAPSEQPSEAAPAEKTEAGQLVDVLEACTVQKAQESPEAADELHPQQSVKGDAQPEGEVTVENASEEAPQAQQPESAQEGAVPSEREVSAEPAVVEHQQQVESAPEEPKSEAAVEPAAVVAEEAASPAEEASSDASSASQPEQAQNGGDSQEAQAEKHEQDTQNNNEEETVEKKSVAVDTTTTGGDEAAQQEAQAAGV